MFEPLPKGVQTHDELIDAKITEIKLAWQDYREHTRVKTTIDGREAIIVDYEATSANVGKLHVLATAGSLVDKVLWAVSCASATEEFSQWEDDLHHIIRSFRILK